MNGLAYGVACWLFLIGLYGVVASRDYIRLIGSLGVIQSATYVLLLAIGYRTGAAPPIATEHAAGTQMVDPVVQALTLTDIVVSAATTALMLTLVVQLRKRRGTIAPDDLKPMQD